MLFSNAGIQRNMVEAWEARAGTNVAWLRCFFRNMGEYVLGGEKPEPTAKVTFLPVVHRNHC